MNTPQQIARRKARKRVKPTKEQIDRLAAEDAALDRWAPYDYDPRGEDQWERERDRQAERY